MAKECAKQSAEENVEKLFQNAKIKRFDARIQTVADDVVRRYDTYVAITITRESCSQSNLQKSSDRIASLSLQPCLPYCGVEVTDGPPFAKINGVVSSGRSVQGV